MGPEALKLANKIGVAGEHPDFPELDWQEAVARGDTREGYWDWVWREIRYESRAWIELEDPQQ